MSSKTVCSRYASSVAPSATGWRSSLSLPDSRQGPRLQRVRPCCRPLSRKLHAVRVASPRGRDAPSALRTGHANTSREETGPDPVPLEARADPFPTVVPESDQPGTSHAATGPTALPRADRRVGCTRMDRGSIPGRTRRTMHRRAECSGRAGRRPRQARASAYRSETSILRSRRR